MSWFVRGVGVAVSRFPGWCLIVLAVLTLALGGLATQQEVAADINEFAPEGELQAQFDRIEDEFGAREGQLQVIVDAGPGGDVLERGGLEVAERVVERLEDTPQVADRLSEDGPMGGGIITYATPVLGELQALDLQTAEATPAFLDAAREQAFSDDAGRDPSALLSDDHDGSSARGGLIIVGLDPTLDDEEIEDATFAVDEALASVDPGFHDVDAFSFTLLNEEMESGMEEDLPLLMGVSFLLIIAILFFLFRRFSDVALGVVGLVAAIVWMAGLSVLLGPHYLGLTGAFSQIAIAVPVLLVGLGIDYSVHLASRYTEERRRGQAAAPAASTAVRTVGVALTLATITTVIGFAANAVSPLPPIADFGWFAAAGIVSAFVVLGLLVPSGRVLLDRRESASMRLAAPEASRERGTDPAGRARPLSWLPVHAPGLTLLGGLVVGVVFTVLATNIDTTFSQDEFIPEDSDAGVILDRVDALFGGDVSEQTYALVDADVRDDEVLRTMAEVERDLGDVDDVSASDGRAEVTSPTGLMHQLDQTVEAVRLQLAAQFALLHDPSGATDQLPLPEELVFDDLPPDMRAEIEDAGGLEGGDDQLPVDDLGALERRLPDGVSAERALLSSLPGAELAELVRGGIGEQIEQDAGDVDPEVAARLAALDADDLTYDRIVEAGYDPDDLDEGLVELLRAGDDLRASGWTGDGISDDADTGGLLGVLEREMDEELPGVLAPDAALMVISTRGGEDRADELVAGIEQALTPLADTVDGEVVVVSQQLLIDETLTQLTDSQINSIIGSLAAALLLLVLYYGVTVRRPALGAITMMPALLAVPLILGSMWLVGLSFNAMTATVASIAIGIGVPYGIHITNRYLEQRELEADPAATIHVTLAHTGAALAGSAVTTASGFGVLLLSDLTPIRQFGGVTSVTILYALVTALLLESSALVLWDRWHRRHEDPGEAAGDVRDPALPDAEVASIAGGRR